MMIRECSISCPCRPCNTFNCMESCVVTVRTTKHTVLRDTSVLAIVIYKFRFVRCRSDRRYCHCGADSRNHHIGIRTNNSCYDYFSFLCILNLHLVKTSPTSSLLVSSIHDVSCMASYSLLIEKFRRPQHNLVFRNRLASIQAYAVSTNAQ
jgi:hypothetical protein